MENQTSDTNLPVPSEAPPAVSSKEDAATILNMKVGQNGYVATGAMDAAEDHSLWLDPSFPLLVTEDNSHHMLVIRTEAGYLVDIHHVAMRLRTWHPHKMDVSGLYPVLTLLY